MNLALVSPIKSKSFLGYWTAPLFAGLLSVMAIGSSFLVKPHSMAGGISNFICFLPMAFFFAAAIQVDNQKQIRVLRHRIEQLEAQSLNPLASPG